MISSLLFSLLHAQAMMQQAIQQMRTMNPAMAQQAEALLSNPAAMQQAAQVSCDW